MNFVSHSTILQLYRLPLPEDVLGIIFSYCYVDAKEVHKDRMEWAFHDIYESLVDSEDEEAQSWTKDIACRTMYLHAMHCLRCGNYRKSGQYSLTYSGSSYCVWYSDTYVHRSRHSLHYVMDKRIRERNYQGLYGIKRSGDEEHFCDPPAFGIEETIAYLRIPATIRCTCDVRESVKKYLT